MCFQAFVFYGDRMRYVKGLVIGIVSGLAAAGVFVAAAGSVAGEGYNVAASLPGTLWLGALVGAMVGILAAALIRPKRRP